jgi:hypothetical protein
MLVEAAFLYRSTNHDVVTTLSRDAFSLYFVIGDKLVEYEVYEGLAPIILFFRHEHVTRRC